MAASPEAGEPVDLYIYDLTQGLAALLSPAIMGRQVEGVWHTSLVVFGREYYYGAGGIATAPIGGTMAGQPREVQRLGVTYVPAAVFREYLQGLAATTFSGSAYNLLEHNCNHFTDEASQFLCGARIPKHIVQQPETDLPPPFRAAIETLLRGQDGGQSISGGGVRYDRQDSPDYLTLNTQIEEARFPLVRSRPHTYSIGTGPDGAPDHIYRTLVGLPSLYVSLRRKFQAARNYLGRPLDRWRPPEVFVTRLAATRAGRTLLLFGVTLRVMSLLRALRMAQWRRMSRRTGDVTRRLDEVPRRTNLVPGQADELPRRLDELPRWTDELRRRTDELPRCTDEFPRRTDELPRRTDELPRRTDELPRRTNEFPRRTDELPRRTDELPRRPDNVPRRWQT